MREAIVRFDELLSQKVNKHTLAEKMAQVASNYASIGQIEKQHFASRKIEIEVKNSIDDINEKLENHNKAFMHVVSEMVAKSLH